MPETSRGLLDTSVIIDLDLIDVDRLPAESAIAGITTWQSWHQRNRSDFAVIMVDKVEIRAAPNTDSMELFSLHEGTRVHVLREAAEWLEIRIADGNVGWLPAASIAVI